MGKADARSTVIEYASFTCPHCAAFATENFPKLKAEYIDTGKVKFIQRDVYFDAPGLVGGDSGRLRRQRKILRRRGNAVLGPERDPQRQEWRVAANLRKVGAKAGMTPEQMDACWADKRMVSDLIHDLPDQCLGRQDRGHAILHHQWRNGAEPALG